MRSKPAFSCACANARRYSMSMAGPLRQMGLRDFLRLDHADEIRRSRWLLVRAACCWNEQGRVARRPADCHQASIEACMY